MTLSYGEVHQEGENQKRQEGRIKTLRSKANVVPRLLLDTPVFSNRKIGFLFFLVEEGSLRGNQSQGGNENELQEIKYCDSMGTHIYFIIRGECLGC